MLCTNRMLPAASLPGYPSSRTALLAWGVKASARQGAPLYFEKAPKSPLPDGVTPVVFIDCMK